jgi:ABC-type lipoprotein export system ATPase subunit
VCIPSSPVFSRHGREGLQFADEPTGALDGATGQEILDVLKQLNRTGKTVILVTHDMRIAQQTQRIIRIEDGRVR